QAEEAKATAALKAHEQAVKSQTLAVKAAKTKADQTAENFTTYDRVKREQYIKDQGWHGRPLTPAEQKQMEDVLNSDPMRMRLKTDKEVAALEAEGAQAKLEEVISAKETT